VAPISSEIGSSSGAPSASFAKVVKTGATRQTTPLTGGVVAYGYVYDAEGRRVAKGTITPSLNPLTQPPSCDPGSNGFTLTESYVLGQDGEELTQLNGNSTNNWQRTNVYGGGKMLATYDTNGLHFQLTDPLGTRRMQTSAIGQPETDIQSLPFGDQLNSFPDPYAPATADDATPLHFTGKERDSESGNDYFSARYFGSSMGRFLSPDPENAGADSEYPQSWNMYSYAANNPLTNFDPDGLECYVVGFGIDTQQGSNNSDQTPASASAYPYSGGGKLSGIASVLGQGLFGPNNATQTLANTLAQYQDEPGGVDVFAFSGSAQALVTGVNSGLISTSNINSVTYLSPGIAPGQSLDVGVADTQAFSGGGQQISS
jgi:RHS repeat-associated protein